MPTTIPPARIEQVKTWIGERRLRDRVFRHTTQDDKQDDEQLYKAGMALIVAAREQALYLRRTGAPCMSTARRIWPWETPAFRPDANPVANYVAAGAYLMAEIERLERFPLYMDDNYATMRVQDTRLLLDKCQQECANVLDGYGSLAGRPVQADAERPWPAIIILGLLLAGALVAGVFLIAEVLR